MHLDAARGTASVSGLFDRLGSAFVAPPGTAPERTARAAPAPPPAPPTIAILCPPGEAHALGGAAARLLAARARSSHALLAVWGVGDPSVRAPATAAARRSVAALTDRGHTAAATGRLCVVSLGGGLDEAASEASRALAAAEAPAVVVLAGPRGPEADALLRVQDAVLIGAAAEADPAVADLASRSVADLGVPTRIVRLPPGAGAARPLAAVGVAVVPPLRAVVEAGLVGLP